MYFSDVACRCSATVQMMLTGGQKYFSVVLLLQDTCLKKIFKSDKLWNCNIYYVFSFPPIISIKGEDFSNELPSSSSSSSLPSSPSLTSSTHSSSDLPHSSFLPHPESPLNPVTPGNLRLEVAAPHYHEDQLQVKVFWKLPNHGELILKHWTNKQKNNPKNEIKKWNIYFRTSNGLHMSCKIIEHIVGTCQQYTNK